MHGEKSTVSRTSKTYWHYIHEQVEKKAIQLEYCESKNMVADM